MIQVRRLGLRVAELPTTFRSLTGRPSFVRPAAVLAFLRDLLRYRLREPRLRRRSPQAAEPQNRTGWGRGEASRRGRERRWRGDPRSRHRP